MQHDIDLIHQVLSDTVLFRGTADNLAEKLLQEKNNIVSAEKGFFPYLV